MSIINSDKSNKSQRKYPIPADAITTLPYHYNHIHDLIDPLSRQWLQESSLFTPEQYNRVANTGLYTEYFYPFITDEDRYDVLNRQMVNFAIIDDHLETPYGDIDRQAMKAKPVLDQFYHVYAKLLGGPNSEHISAHSWKPYVLATAPVRRISVAFMPIYYMCEYAHLMFVPEDEWHNPRMQRLFKLLSKAGVMCNDIYSFEKKVLDAGGLPDGAYNGVSVLCRMHDIPVADAMHRLAQMCRELEREAQGLVAEIQMADWACAHMRDFVARLLWINGGNWKVCTIY
ncbi:unnamed protein product [Medioppia subpectinata]|uniref:Terpene synthase n=1 Tax=Medioppia subpectinata TaxID=1979941 RepID=A0A7R9LC46_9ACAR|nr:unnamed protein product [Medioppia subpectinata]CAG2117083.1 unnamed protein product [Medioppia subpectinata]